MKASEVSQAVSILQKGKDEGKDLAQVIEDAREAKMKPQVIRVMVSAMEDGKDITRVIEEGQQALGTSDPYFWDKEDEPAAQFALIVVLITQLGTALEMMFAAHGDLIEQDVIDLPAGFIVDATALDEWRRKCIESRGLSDAEKITSVTFIHNGLVKATKNFQD